MATLSFTLEILSWVISLLISGIGLIELKNHYTVKFALLHQTPDSAHKPVTDTDFIIGRTYAAI